MISINYGFQPGTVKFYGQNFQIVFLRESLNDHPYVFNLIKMRLTEWEIPFTEDEINKLIEKGKDLFPNFKWNI